MRKQVGAGLIILAGVVGWLVGHHDPSPKVIGQETIRVIHAEPQVIEKVVPVERVVIVEKKCCDEGCKGAGCDLKKCDCKDCPHRKREETRERENKPLSALPPTVKTIQQQGQEYGYARADAVNNNLPLVVGVKQDPPQLPPAKAKTVRWDAFPGVLRGLVIGLPQDGELWQAAVLGTDETVESVLAEIEAARWRVFSTPRTFTVQQPGFSGFSQGCVGGS